MSTVTGALGDEDRENAWIREGERLQRIEAAPVRVKCRTLSDIIASCGHPAIDFLSLDVEGYERQVLSGLDLSKHRPRFLLVETRVTTETEIDTLLTGYRLLDQPSPYDSLYQDESAA
jgi:FkbM family methyltransferase